jgi:hypothetical protein
MEMEMEIEMEMDIESALNKMFIFSDKQEYMRLYEASIIDLNDVSEVDLLDILNDAFDRYIEYLKTIEFIGESKYIKVLIEKYIQLYKSNKIDNEKLFNMMKSIDSSILDIIHDSTEPVFWLNSLKN